MKIALIFAATVASVMSIGFDDLPGDYCIKRPPATQCCANREDDCSMPVIVPDSEDTRCYCDAFCEPAVNQGHKDCCPDYYRVCKGIQPQTGADCRAGDKTYRSGEKQVEVFCKSCDCVDGRFENCRPNIECLIDQEVSDTINGNRGSSYTTTTDYHRFQTWTLDEGAMYLGGTVIDSNDRFVGGARFTGEDPGLLNYDSRVDSTSTIHPSYDQGKCGIGHISAVQASASDWLVRDKSGLYTDESISYKAMIDCVISGRNLCESGHEYLQVLSLSGTAIQDPGMYLESCFETHKTNFDGETIIGTGCVVRRGRCPDAAADIIRVNSTGVQRVKPEEGNIKHHIKRFGSLIAGIRLTRQFVMYKSGVFAFDRNMDPRDYLGTTPKYHTVRVIGWGTENGQDYWLCINSWGDKWGESGTVKIARRNHNVEFEDFIAYLDVHMAPSGNNRRRARLGRRHHKRSEDIGQVVDAVFSD